MNHHKTAYAVIDFLKNLIQFHFPFWFNYRPVFPAILVGSIIAGYTFGLMITANSSFWAAAENFA
jgi:hypothetical protein